MHLQPATLIVFGGLPGTGKTTVSCGLTRRLAATYLRVDAIEQTLRASGAEVGATGYVIANALAAENLKLGRIVVVDCVNPVFESRNGWRETAALTSAGLVEIELVCSDPSKHRERVEGRSADIPGLILPTWADVQKRIYEPWDQDHFVLDTATISVPDLIDSSEAHIRNATRLRR